MCDASMHTMHTHMTCIHAASTDNMTTTTTTTAQILSYSPETSEVIPTATPVLVVINRDNDESSQSESSDSEESEDY